MAKASGSISSRAIAARDAASTLTIGGQSYAVKRQVTLPTLKQEDNAVAFVVLDKMYTGRPIRPKDSAVAAMAPATLVKVRDLETKRPHIYVVPAVLKSMWIDEYDGDRPAGYYDDKDPEYQGQNTYVGLAFAVQKLAKRAGKRHRDLEVVEIDIPDNPV